MEADNDVFWVVDQNDAWIVRRFTGRTINRRGKGKYGKGRRKGKGGEKGGRGFFGPYGKGKSSKGNGRRKTGKAWSAENDGQQESYADWNKGTGKKGKDKGKGEKSKADKGKGKADGTPNAIANAAESEPSTAPVGDAQDWSTSQDSWDTNWNDSWWTAQTWVEDNWTSSQNEYSNHGYGESIAWMATKIETDSDINFQNMIHSNVTKELQYIDLETKMAAVDELTAEMECMFLEISKNPTLVVLDLACTKCMGSRYACENLVTALEKTDIKCRYIPGKGTFRFGNGEREAVNWALELTIPQGYGEDPLRTTIDIIEKGKTPILWSLPQMENLEFDLKCRKGKVYLSCDLFGWNQEELPRSNTNHCCIDVTWFLWQGAKLRPKNMIHYDRANGPELQGAQTFVAIEDVTETEEALVEEAFPGNAAQPKPTSDETTCPACRGLHEKHTGRKDCRNWQDSRVTCWSVCLACAKTKDGCEEDAKRKTTERRATNF